MLSLVYFVISNHMGVVILEDCMVSIEVCNDITEFQRVSHINIVMLI